MPVKWCHSPDFSRCPISCLYTHLVVISTLLMYYIKIKTFVRCSRNFPTPQKWSIHNTTVVFWVSRPRMCPNQSSYRLTDISPSPPYTEVQHRSLKTCHCCCWFWLQNIEHFLVRQLNKSSNSLDWRPKKSIECVVYPRAKDVKQINGYWFVEKMPVDELHYFSMHIDFK